MVCPSQLPCFFVVDNDRGVQPISSTVSVAWSSSISISITVIFIGVMFSLSSQISLTCTWRFAGNGTQSIAWQINEETYRLTLESEHAKENGTQKPGLQIYYSSLHDILSYPCEVRRLMPCLGQCHSIYKQDGKLELVQAASVSIHGPHGQHIENIHLQPYSSEEHFWSVLYKENYSKLLTKAEEFLTLSDSKGDALVLIRSR